MIIDLDHDFLLHGTVFSRDRSVAFESKHGTLVGKPLYKFPQSLRGVLNEASVNELRTETLIHELQRELHRVNFGSILTR